jgi:hypothetical protein
VRNCATKATPAGHAKVEPRLRDGFLGLSRVSARAEAGVAIAIGAAR